MELPFSEQEILEASDNIINSKVKPYIASHGGDIKLIKVINNEIFVKLKGSCSGCASSDSTIKNLVEKEIKTFIHPDLRIIQIKE